MKVNKWTFQAEPYGNKWFPVGRSENGIDDAWADGCITDNKHLADMIANNMHQSFNAGWNEAMKYISSMIKDGNSAIWRR